MDSVRAHMGNGRWFVIVLCGVVVEGRRRGRAEVWEKGTYPAAG